METKPKDIAPEPIERGGMGPSSLSLERTK
jgi:hypothetical protein